MPAPTENVVLDTPWSVHGETTEKPKPIPNASKISEAAAAATPPARMAPHETADNPPSSIIVPVAMGVAMSASGKVKSLVTRMATVITGACSRLCQINRQIDCETH